LDNEDEIFKRFSDKIKKEKVDESARALSLESLEKKVEETQGLLSKKIFLKIRYFL